MMSLVLVALLVLWAMGYITIPGVVIRDITLFNFNGRAISLWDVLMFLVILWAIETLPSPLREISVILILLWVLSTIGIIAIAGFQTLVVVALVFGLIFAITQNNKQQ